MSSSFGEIATLRADKCGKLLSLRGSIAEKWRICWLMNGGDCLELSWRPAILTGASFPSAERQRCEEISFYSKPLGIKNLLIVFSVNWVIVCLEWDGGEWICWWGNFIISESYLRQADNYTTRDDNGQIRRRVYVWLRWVPHFQHTIIISSQSSVRAAVILWSSCIFPDTQDH